MPDIEDGKFTISSNTETVEAMEAAVAPLEATDATDDDLEKDAGATLAVPSALPTPSPSGATDAAAGAASASPKPKTKESPQQRIDKAVAKQREAERERDELKARLAAQPSPQPQLGDRFRELAKQQAGAAATDDDPEPMYVEGENPQDWVRAHNRWSARQEIQVAEKRREEQWRAEQVYRADQARSETFVANAKATGAYGPAFIATLHPDVQNLDLRQRTPITDSILASQNPKAVLQYLSDHPEDLQRMATLHPVDVIREMAGYDTPRTAAAHSGPAPTPLVISQAKKPIQPVGGSPSVSDDDADADSLSVDEFIRRENKKDPRFAAARR